MPEPDDFFDFAAARVCELVRLGHASTGAVDAGERLVEEALVEVFRSWPQSQPSGDPLLTARRALAAAHRRWSQSARPSRRVALELHDVRAADDDQERAAVLDGGVGLWEALEFLSPRQRLTVALRFAGDLTPGETAHVLNRPVMLVRRSERQALNELGLAADLPHDLASAPDARLSAESDLAERLRLVLRTQVGVPFEPEPLLQRVRHRTGRVRQRSARFPVQAVATSALALVGASVVIWSVLASDAPNDSGLENRPPSAQGTQLVGYRSIAVAVPANWRLNESPCGRTAADGRVYRSAQTDGGRCTPAAGGSNVTFADAPLYPSPLQEPPQTAGQVGNHLTLRTNLTHSDGGYEQTVLVPKAMFVIVVTVRSPDRSVVEDIVNSARGVPEGFAIVPKCESLPVREAVAALSRAGLTSKVLHTSALSVRYSVPPVTFQDRRPGSVIPTGSAVALTIPSF